MYVLPLQLFFIKAHLRKICKSTVASFFKSVYIRLSEEKISKAFPLVCQHIKSPDYRSLRHILHVWPIKDIDVVC